MEKEELNQFIKIKKIRSCNIYYETERLKIWHQLKNKGRIKYKGTQNELQFFQVIK